MPTPDFVLALREHVGPGLLWLPAVAAVVVRSGAAGTGEVLLVRRSDTGEWTPVTGILDPGEEPAVGAVREVLEETGVVARAERLVGAAATPVVQYPNGDRSAFLTLCFRCAYVSGEAYAADDESTEARWYAVDALPDLAPDHRRGVGLALANAPEADFAR